MRNQVFEDDKRVETIDTHGNHKKVTVINEPGLYTEVFGSRLEFVKSFKH